MRRQGAATPGATHRVSVGGAPSVRLPRQPHTAPLKRLPPHLAMAAPIRRKAPREHRGKCGGRARQPRGQLTGCLWELPPAFACRGSHAPPRSGACRLTARHGGANSAQGTQGAPRKMQRQGAATPGSTHRVSVGCAPSLRLPRQPQTAPLRRLPPAPLPSALRLKNNNNVQRQNSCNRQ